MGDEGHAQHPARLDPEVVQRLDHLDAAALAAAPGVDLGFHHPHRAAQFLAGGDRLVDAECRESARNRDAEFGEDRLGLVFVDVH
jgi:hypothetical protein